MRNLLKHIENLPELAQETNWSASGLARKCGVSLRCLERAFQRDMRTTARAWLTEQRMVTGATLLADDLSVKEAAAELGYTEPGNFSRAFSRFFGRPPRARSPRAQAMARRCRDLI